MNYRGAFSKGQKLGRPEVVYKKNHPKGLFAGNVEKKKLAERRVVKQKA